MDAGLVSGIEAVAVPLVVVAVRVAVEQIKLRIAEGDVAADMVAGGPRYRGRCRGHCC